MSFQKWALTLSVLISACASRNNRDEKLLEEAAVVHNDMIALAGQLEAQLTTMEFDTTGFISKDSIRTWKSEIETWEEEIVEVPGNEEHAGHNEGEHHHHHDDKKVEVTAQEMLFIQQALKRKLESIQLRIKSAPKE